MPLRIRNKEMARVDALRKSIYREPDAGESFGKYVDIPWYHHGQLPLFIRLQVEESLKDKPVFVSRVPTGGLFNKGPNGSETPCKLNMLDILDVKRHWAVLEHQAVMKGTMAKRFTVTAEEARQEVDKNGTTHQTAHLSLRDSLSLHNEVPLTQMPEGMVDRCQEASHSHVPSFHFPMGTDVKERKELMSQHFLDDEVAQINTANDRGHGDVRNQSCDLNITPSRLVEKRSPSPQKMVRNESAATMLTAGTMMSKRSFASPGLPDEGTLSAGFAVKPMGLPHITFAKKPPPKKMKPWLSRRGSLSTVKSKGWKERDLTRSLSVLGP